MWYLCFCNNIQCREYSVTIFSVGRLEDVRDRQHTEPSLCDEAQVAGIDHLHKEAKGSLMAMSC